MSNVTGSQMIAISSLLIAGQGLGVFLLIMSSRHKKSLSRYLLAAYIAVSSIWFFLDYLLHDGVTVPYYFLIVGKFSVLEGPLFYLYVRALVSPGWRLQWQQAIHIWPMLMYGLPDIPGLALSSGTVNIFAYYLSLVGYLAACARILPGYNQFVRGNFSSVENYSLDWLYKLVIAYLSLSIVFLIWRTLEFGLQLNAVEGYLYIPNTLVSFVVFYFIALGGYHQRSLNAESLTKSKAEPLDTLPLNLSKYQHSSLSQERCQEIWQTLNAHMRKEEPFLQETLTLADLAEEIELSRNQISEVINRLSCQSFYDYINRYRAEKAEALIQIGAAEKMTMVDLGVDVGFANKATFYKHFKKRFGKPPLQYKKELNE